MIETSSTQNQFLGAMALKQDAKFRGEKADIIPIA